MSENQPQPSPADRFVGAAHGDLESVKKMLAEDPDLLEARSSQDESALQAATHTGQRHIVEFLLEQGAAIDICTAAFLGRRDEVRRMLEEDPALKDAQGAHGLPVLYYPVLSGEQETAHLLAEHGASVNGGEGVSTPLHAAAMTGRAEMARWLVDNGASLEAQDYSQKTPAEVAAAMGNDDVHAVLTSDG